MSETTVDRTRPDGRWMFDSDVTDAFDNMLERSIPNYRTMRDAVVQVGGRFLSGAPHVIDVGASRGEAISPFVEAHPDVGRFVAVEPSAPMAAALRERFNGSAVEVIEMDARQYEPEGGADLVLSVLTLQFIPIEHRQKLVHRLFSSLRPGGALILVEKIIGGDHELNDLMVAIYHRLKMTNGYTREDVDLKGYRLVAVGLLW